MKERPILFSAPMVRALLAGTKTQTRRVVKAARDPSIGCWMTPGEIALDSATVQEHISPYGQPGDRLWVREATHRRPMLNLLTGEPLAPEHDGGAYTADGEDVLNPDGFDFAWWYSRKACPSIHMPRWASRITLEITGVRVERLQAISEADAKAEGIEQTAHDFWRLYGSHYGANATFSPRTSFRTLWESINGADSWAGDPWVWVVEFRRLLA